VPPVASRKIGVQPEPGAEEDRWACGGFSAWATVVLAAIAAGALAAAVTFTAGLRFRIPLAPAGSHANHRFRSRR